MNVHEKRNAIQLAMAKAVPMTLRFKYEKGDGTSEDRHVEPYELKEAGKDQTLTLFAHDLVRDAMRQFKLDRMGDVSEGEKFNPRHPVVVPC